MLRGHEGAELHGVIVDVDDRRATVLVRRPPLVAPLAPDGAALGDEVTVRLVEADPAGRRVGLVRVV